MPLKNPPSLKPDTGAKSRIRRGYLTVGQVRATVNTEPDLQRRTLFKVLYYCALRASEPGLQPKEHFNAERRTLDIRRLKNSDGHTYGLEPWVYDDLRKWNLKRDPRSPFLFHHPLDVRHPLDRYNVYRWWREAVQRSGIAKTELELTRLGHPHVLKHSIATHMFDRGDDIYFVQTWLGHRKLENTLVYAEIAGKRLREGQLVMRGLTKELS